MGAFVGVRAAPSRSLGLATPIPGFSGFLCFAANHEITDRLDALHEVPDHDDRSYREAQKKEKVF